MKFVRNCRKLKINKLIFLQNAILILRQSLFNYNSNMNNSNNIVVNDYQLILYILNTSKDKSIAHILQRFNNLKKMMYD